jgi:small-conductance mechanosensitive channel
MADLLANFLLLLTKPLALFELLTLIILLGVAWLLARGLRKQVRQDSRAGGLRQVAFPLLAILLFWTFQFTAHHNGWHLHLVSGGLQLLWAMVGIRVVVFTVQRIFPNALWMRNFGRSIAVLVWFCVVLDFLGILPDLIDWLDGLVLPLGKSHVSLWTILQGLASVFGSVIVALWIGGLIEGRLMQASTMDSSVRVVLTRVAKALLVLFAILVGMEMVGLDVTTLSVFGGALGVGLGFGMQKIASNYVSGFIILLDHSIRIGNIIQVGSERGEVKQITTRYTVLLSGNGAHFLVPNENLVGGTVQNDSYGDPRSRAAVRLQVAYDTDVERALVVLEEIASAHSAVLADPPPQGFLVAFEDSGILLELGFWIANPANGYLGVCSQINRAILRRLREENISIPFPQREVRMINPATH